MIKIMIIVPEFKSFEKLYKYICLLYITLYTYIQGTQKKIKNVLQNWKEVGMA